MAHFASLLAGMVTYRITPLKDTTSSQNMLTSEETMVNITNKTIGSIENERFIGASIATLSIRS